MYEAKMLADSISPDGIRLTTMECVFPRPYLAEFNTHRVFSRNSASSRAIPIHKQLAMLESDPYIPEWRGEQKGMSGAEGLAALTQLKAKIEWTKARDNAMGSAEALRDLGIHKSIANRLLEPFMWHRVICTSSEWANFFALRTDENAQPEIQIIAKMMRELYETHEPRLLDYGEWHLPLVYDEDIRKCSQARIDWNTLKRISVGRCARVSYLTHDGKRDLEADIDLHDRLIANGHMSPTEHVARPIDSVANPHNTWSGNFRGWHQYRSDIPNQDNFQRVLDEVAN